MNVASNNTNGDHPILVLGEKKLPQPQPFRLGGGLRSSSVHKDGDNDDGQESVLTVRTTNTSVTAKRSNISSNSGINKHYYNKMDDDDDDEPTATRKRLLQDYIDGLDNNTRFEYLITTGDFDWTVGFVRLQVPGYNNNTTSDDDIIRRDIELAVRTRIGREQQQQQRPPPQGLLLQVQPPLQQPQRHRRHRTAAQRWEHQLNVGTSHAAPSSSSNNANDNADTDGTNGTTNTTTTLEQTLHTTSSITTRSKGEASQVTSCLPVNNVAPTGATTNPGGDPLVLLQQPQQRPRPGLRRNAETNENCCFFNILWQPTTSHNDIFLETNPILPFAVNE